MANVSNIIWKLQNLLVHARQVPRDLWVLIAGLHDLLLSWCSNTIPLACRYHPGASILGILGSYVSPGSESESIPCANSRTAFSALKGNPLATLGIPLRSGMSVGLLLVAVELFFMICILMFLVIWPVLASSVCNWRSLGASVLRICGGNFSQDRRHRLRLDEIVFKLPRR